LKFFSLVMTQRLQFTPQSIPSLVRFSNFAAQLAIAGECVEYFQVCLRVEKSLLIAQSVNVEEIETQIAQ